MLISDNTFSIAFTTIDTFRFKYMGTEMHVHIYSVARVFRTTNFIWYNVVWAHTVMAFLLPCFFVGQSLSVILMYWWECP